MEIASFVTRKPVPKKTREQKRQEAQTQFKKSMHRRGIWAALAKVKE